MIYGIIIDRNLMMELIFERIKLILPEDGYIESCVFYSVLIFTFVHLYVFFVISSLTGIVSIYLKCYN